VCVCVCARVQRRRGIPDMLATDSEDLEGMDHDDDDDDMMVSVGYACQPRRAMRVHGRGWVGHGCVYVCACVCAHACVSLRVRVCMSPVSPGAAGGGPRVLPLGSAYASGRCLHVYIGVHVRLHGSSTSQSSSLVLLLVWVLSSCVLSSGLCPPASLNALLLCPCALCCYAIRLSPACALPGVAALAGRRVWQRGGSYGGAAFAPPLRETGFVCACSIGRKGLHH